jgi:hypothetical protein
MPSTLRPSEAEGLQDGTHANALAAIADKQAVWCIVKAQADAWV